MLSEASWVTTLVFVADFVVRLALSFRVIMRRLPVGVSLAWLFVVLVFPFFGVGVYLLIGEARLGKKRAARAASIHEPYENWLRELDARAAQWSNHDPRDHSLATLAQRAVGIPALPGNKLELLGDWESAFQSLLRDIDSAQRTCHLEFYIWNEGGLADEVGEALLRAVQRGVACRVLLDDVGSRPFLRGGWVEKLRSGGVDLHAALPANLLRMAAVRFDLRMHRKIVVIDGRVAYTGSLNLVDPRHFKQEVGVGQWVDAMVRIEGPAVEPLAITFLEDWTLETDISVEELRELGDVHPMRPRGEAVVQVIPSGPVQNPAAMRRILLSAIYEAQRELVLTTPYFVPDDDLVTALISAAHRGVNVTLIVPENVDSRLVHWASRAFLGDLADAGVNVLLFRGGLLHTKSVAIDGETCLVGSLNLDPRSLHLNFEITLAVYDTALTGKLRELQGRYEEMSRVSSSDDWLRRTRRERFLENAARLFGPLL